MRIRYKPWMPASALAAVIFTIWFLSWWGGQPSIRPRDMPRDSVWIHAPNLPFEWHHGWWFGCWIDSDGHSNRCRLWGGQGDKPIVFEGLYISCKDHSPVPASELKLKAPPDRRKCGLEDQRRQRFFRTETTLFRLFHLTAAKN
jgi:hypothetical protein